MRTNTTLNATTLPPTPPPSEHIALSPKPCFNATPIVGALPRLELIFVQGLPRSGTTLVTRFIEMHDEVLGVARYAPGIQRDADEYCPGGSLAYSGSRECLTLMCGAQNNSYVHRVAADHRRFDCRPYAERAVEVANASGIPDASGLRFVVKHPALMLGSARLLASCAALGVRTRFVEVTREAHEWYSDLFPCTGTCRDAILDNTARCERLSGVNRARDTHRIRFEWFGHVSVWRSLEEWLQLASIAIDVQNGKPTKPHTASTKPIPVHSAHPHAPLRRRLVIHGNDRGVNQSFTVYLGYLDRVCAAQAAPSVDPAPARHVQSGSPPLHAS